MKAVLNRLFDHEQLTMAEAHELLVRISEGAMNPSQMAAFLSVFIMRDISADELNGFRKALLELCVKVDFGGRKSIDLCGTGGDGKDTFNISTLASFVTAGAGYAVTKHGNYGVSSVCGSSNVLEHLGYSFTHDSDTLNRQLDKAGICFLHAPLFHPAMKTVAPIRRELGVKTFFNMLGPLVNPCQPTHQMIGVFNLKVLRLYHYLHQNIDRRYSLLHSLDGYDEISLTGPFKRITPEGEQLLEPADLNLRQLQQSDLFGGSTVEEAAMLFTDILDGKGTRAQNDVVCANAATAIFALEPNKPWEQCLMQARESLDSGKARTALQTLIETH